MLLDMLQVQRTRQYNDRAPRALTGAQRPVLSMHMICPAANAQQLHTTMQHLADFCADLTHCCASIRLLNGTILGIGQKL